jgi:hypothetical protein
MVEGDEDEVAALTPKPASSDGWTQRRWALHYREHAKALQARIVELQAEAGIRAKAERLEEGPLFPRIDFRPFNPKAHEAEREREKDHYRYGQRRLYFSIEDEALRKRLIRLDRAQDLAALHFHEAEKGAEHHDFAALEGRARPWATTAAIQAVVATLAGALIGHVAGGLDIVRQLFDGGAAEIGAVAGAAVGLVGAIRLRDYAEYARRKEIADARELLAENDRIYQAILDEPETFTSWEEHTGRSGDQASA